MVCKFNKRIVIFIVLAILYASLFSACSKNTSSDSIVSDGDRTAYVYSSKCLDFYNEDAAVSVMGVYLCDETLYCVTQEILLDLSASHNYLCSYTLDGELISKLELSEELDVYSSTSIVDNKLMYVTWSNKVESVDLATGVIVDTLQFNQRVCGVSECNEGYVILLEGRIEKYDLDGQMLGSISGDELKFSNRKKSFYEDGDKCYILVDSEYSCKYYEADFDSSNIQLVYDPESLGRDVISCYGPYIFTDEGEFCFDFLNASMSVLAYWDGMNLQPSKYGRCTPDYYGIDSERFIQVYNYDNGLAQLLFYTYAHDEDYNDRTELVIGGFNCKYDTTLNWAVYEFNTSQEEYRARIEDYSYEYGWDSYMTADSQIAELIQYFNSGNAPDIFYGEYFDYDNFAESGMILEISQYMSDSFVDSLDEVTPSIKSLMFNENEECYSVFSSYQINGFLAGSNFVGDSSDISINQTYAITDDNGMNIINSSSSSDLAVNTIMYYVRENSDFTYEDVEAMLVYSIDAGIPSYGNADFLSLSEVTVDQYLLWDTTLFSAIEIDDLQQDGSLDLTYVGYPSVNGSYHVIRPFGQMAISSSTENPEVCCELLSYIFDYDVQKLSALSWYIPVNNVEMIKFTNYSNDHSSIPEEDYEYRLLLSCFAEVDSDSVECFQNAINSVDTITFYDWGMASIIDDEITSYYSQNKPISEIASSLYSRLLLYLSEEN